MQLGLFTPVFNTLGLQDLLAALKRFPAIRQLEFGTGGWPGNHHLDPSALLNSSERRQELLQRLAAAGLSISALSCHSNPVHPVEGVAKQAQELYSRTVRLAEQLGVATVVTFSGCPGGGPEDRTPNWVTVSWPPEYSQSLQWQWSERLIPYWRQAAEEARNAGVRVALEAHPGFCVYNPETLLRLRGEAGQNLGINFDPSHLWWQGVDPPTAVAALGDSIFHVHAKDVALNPANRARNGVLDTKSYSQMKDRSWLFRTVGWGHDELEWKTLVSALRLAGYDGVLSIEHEDALASIEEGLASAIGMLSRVLLQQPAVDPWWL